MRKSYSQDCSLASEEGVLKAAARDFVATHHTIVRVCLLSSHGTSTSTRILPRSAVHVEEGGDTLALCCAPRRFTCANIPHPQSALQTSRGQAATIRAEGEACHRRCEQLISRNFIDGASGYSDGVFGAASCRAVASKLTDLRSTS